MIDDSGRRAGVWASGRDKPLPKRRQVMGTGWARGTEQVGGRGAGGGDAGQAVVMRGRDKPLPLLYRREGCARRVGGEMRAGG
jgi:hypothetical protein